jgi:hypothetical protein
MRGVHKFMLTVGVTAVAFGLALGQGFPGGRGGGFFGGGKGGNDPVALLRNDSVKKELKLTDEQLAKVPEAVWKALGEVLDAGQQKRLKQIVLQLQGINAFADSKIQSALKMNDDQKDGIKTALENQAKETKELFADLKGGGADFNEIREKMAAIRKGTTEKIQGLLTAAQKRQWTEMIGEEFKMEFGGFGKGFGKGKGKGGFGKKKKKNNDTE